MSIAIINNPNTMSNYVTIVTSPSKFLIYFKLAVAQGDFRIIQWAIKHSSPPECGNASCDTTTVGQSITNTGTLCALW